MQDHTPQLPLFTTSPADPSLEIPYGYCHCGCGEKTQIARKTCSKYNQTKGQPKPYVYGHQSQLHKPRQKRSAADRFWEKVDRRGPDDCWEWQASTYSSGYGQFWDGNRITGAHRFSYSLANGPIPDDFYVCHQCDNKICCNPTHLWAGTPQENIDDMHLKGRNGQPSGERQRSARFAAEEVREIRRIYNTGNYSMASLGRKLGVSSTSIRFIVLGLSYKNI